MTDAEDAFWRTGERSYVLLTTFRRSGVGVATPVWLARHGDALVVTTGATSGKVKRLRNNPKVLITPSGRLGRVSIGAPVTEGVGEVLGPDSEHTDAVAALAGKYGWQYQLVQRVEKLVASRRRTSEPERVIIALRPAAAGG